MALKVAIVGLAPSSHDAPWDDPAWELWGLPWDAYRLRFHRTFEMHDVKTLKACFPDFKGYCARLADCANLHMQEAYAEVPNARRFPFEAVSADVGNYWCSSIAYMMSLAIHEGAEKIGLWGVDMRADEEYGYQKANMEYLIGLARGRGIEVHIPEASPLCKFQSMPGCDHDGRYGLTKG